MASTLDFLKRLTDHNVEFVVVGGLAGVFHGSHIVTEDIDLCAPLTGENLTRILAALKGTHPRFRMNPDHPPLPDDPARLKGFSNLYLTTDLGQLDILDEILAVGGYTEVAQHTVTVDVGGVSCRILGIDALIRAKRALGRPRDVQAATELEAIRDRQRRQGNGRYQR